MSQPVYNNFRQGTSTGGVSINTGPTILHSIVIGSSSTAGYVFYNATSSAVATNQTVGLLAQQPQTYVYDVIFPTGLFFGQTTSTSEMNVTWA